MFLSLRSWVNRLAGLSILLLPALGWAQCPGAAACTPGKASSALAPAYNMGIYTVTLGSINNTTPGYTDGYKDYSCATTGAVSTTLTVGTPTAITIKNNPASTATPENVRVWLDYNNDGAFSSTELAFSSDNKTSHTGTITPPATAALGVPLRLRVASDYANSALPTPCSTPEYSQDEDYSVTLAANTSQPVAAFTQNATTTCSGQVQFTDQSTNAPTSWRWDFGDGSTSTQQNPLHTYAAAGTYSVTLTATNATGSSTSAATAITYNPAVPLAATACPGLPAAGYCCNYGIVRVRLGTLDNASADGSAGYQDFTCGQRTTLSVGAAYSLIINTGGTRTHDVRAWLDLNNDGTFSAGEKLAEALITTSPTLSFTLPASTVLNQPLRLRLVADASGTFPQPCAAPTSGQVEDYTVTVVPNTSAPAVAFTSTYVAGACASPANTYTFTDQSTNAPTAWLWSFSPSAGVTFVNGTSASSQNPQVAFAAAGYYAVSLRASNANGTATLTQPNYLLVQVPCLAYCAASGGYATGAASALWITNVGVSAGGAGGAAFANASGNSAGGYTFFGGQTVALTGGTTQTISVTTNLSAAHRTTIWVDYNRDGVFANTTGAGGELVYNGLSSLATTAVAAAIPSSAGATRLRVAVAQNNNTANPCLTNQGEAEVEDYPVTISAALATREAQALPALTVSPNPTPDGRLLVQLSEAGANGTYTLQVANVLGATLFTQPLRLSAAAPASLDLSALPAGLYLLRLTDAQGQTALRRLVRQ